MTVVLWIGFWLCLLSFVLLGASNWDDNRKAAEARDALKALPSTDSDAATSLREQIERLREQTRRGGLIMGLLMIAAPIFAVAARLG